MKTLDGQSAIVTGAGSGIGRGIGDVLAAEGARVIIVDLDRKAADTAASQINDKGGRALAIAADVSNSTDVAGLVADARDWAGRIDILASNVGIFPSAALESIDEATWDRVMAVNVRGAFLLFREILPGMRSHGYGRVIVTSSITGPMTAMPTLTHYAASKAALMGLVRGAALEYANAGITVNAVLPGTVDTEGLREGGGQDYVDLMLPSIPVGRLASGEDIAWIVRMLAAPEAGYVTGVGIPVDGGQTLPEGHIPATLIEQLTSGDTGE